MKFPPQWAPPFTALVAIGVKTSILILFKNGKLDNSARKLKSYRVVIEYQ
jgi:hypothetical protein